MVSTRDPRDIARALDPAVLFADAFGHEAMAHQVEYLRAEVPVIVLKGRQTGFSQAAAALAIHRAMFWPGSLSAIVSPTQRQSSEVAMRARMGLHGLKERAVQDSATMVRLHNDSRILSLPGSSKSVRGWSVDGVLVLDEAAFLEDETVAVARATTAVGGRIVVQSTPAGEGGAFHGMWSDTPPGWMRMRVPTEEAMTVPAAFLEQERRSLPPDVFAQEYECRFGVAGRGLFTEAQVAAMTKDEPMYGPFAKLEEIVK